MQPLRLTPTLIDLRAAIPREQPEIANRFRRHEARSQQAGLRELAQPHRIADIGLASREVLHVAGVDHLNAVKDSAAGGCLARGSSGGS